ncbi:hypothetical protein AVEN_230095-1 [Araneus ventricosus]|uniref:Uncharacterized protein n=1 Tax=Araneus ventricosus TaxID=182803 RepID=A0A4Y2ILB3_ARAVE|nr:hypothetical protein AVEN_230095-1 [Araneus ventricosus]
MHLCLNSVGRGGLVVESLIRDWKVPDLSLDLAKYCSVRPVLPPREKYPISQTPEIPVAVVMETGYSTTFGGGEEKGYISFGADRTVGSLITLCTSVENEFLA